MRVIIIHPQLRNYRLKIFEKLNQHYEIKFFFIKQHSEDISVPLNWKYKVLSSNKDKFSFLWKIRLIIELVKNRKEFDIILTSIVSSAQSRICFLLAKIMNKRFVTWDLIWYWGGSILSRFKKFYSSFILQNSDSCICYGTKTKELWLRMGVAPEKIFLSNPCVMDHSIDDIHNDLREKLYIKDKKVVLYLSRVINWKGLNVLIKAFKLIEEKMDDGVLVIGGDGDFRGRCEQLSEELKVRNLHFLGKIPEDEVDIYYKACDVFVLPSIFLRNPTGTYSYELWGLVINEALSFSLPIITTDAVGAGFDLVRDGYNGFIVKNNSVKDLYEALMKILSDSYMAEKMGKRSRKIFEEFNDYDKMFMGIDEALKYAMGE
ncbi:MAG: glycosyltransferase family 4 protein [Candidatus Hodarchaeota archaeon]